MYNSPVFHRELGRPAVALSSNHASILAEHGPLQYKSVIDLSSGAGVTCLGHDATIVKNAICRQVNELPYVHSALWTTDNTEGLAYALLARVPQYAPGGSVMFLSTGAEAVEAACKLAVQFWVERGKKPEDANIRFFPRYHSYHGNTSFTLALGDHPRKYNYHAITPRGVGGELFYRFASFGPGWKRDLTSLRTCLARSKDWGCGSVVVVETIGGTTVGIQPPEAEYLADIREACTQHDALLIYDEVLCGNHRTGELFAWQCYAKQTTRRVEPDMTVMGKGLTAGYFPLSAVVVSGNVMDAIRSGSKKLWHSTTNQNHPIGCAAAMAASVAYHESASDIDRLTRTLTVPVYCMLKECPHVKEVRGVGTLWGVELVRGDVPGLHRRIRAAAFDAGLALYTEGQTIAGDGNFIMIAPPYCMDNDTLFKAIEILIHTITSVCGELK